MRQSSRNIRLLIRLSIAVSLLASQAAVGAVPCVLPKTQAPDAVPGRVVDCRDMQGGLRSGKCVKGDKKDGMMEGKKGGMMGGGMMMMHKKMEQRLDMLEQMLEQMVEHEAAEETLESH